MPVWLQLLVTAFTATMASTGFWTWIEHKRSKKDAKTRAILGLLHEQIMTKGEKHLSVGHISIDEFNDYFKYFYDPYHDLGGNGTGERMADAVRNLPIK